MNTDELKKIAVAAEKDPTQGRFVALMAETYIAADWEYEILLRPIWEKLVQCFRLDKVYKL